MKVRMFAFIAVFGTVLLGENMKVGATEVPENMVLIPAGEFFMGSLSTERGRDLDEALHKVTLTKSFYMSKFEVTQEEYLSVMGINPSYFIGKPNHPVEQVSWFNAMEYCEKLTTKERMTGRLTAGWEYRLPTEAEWEYACRAGTSTTFHYGSDLRSGMANFNGKEEYVETTGSVTNSNGTYFGRTVAVGSYQPNAFELYDMHGNVWEWCLDWYGTYPNGNVSDPKGPSVGSDRVFRGGTWSFNAWNCRSAHRFFITPTARDYNIGFRTVLASIAGIETPEWRQVIETQPTQPTYSEPPKKEIGKDSLIVVTHGWQPAWKPVDIKWVDTMTNAISKYLVKQGLTDWQVHAYRWVEGARPNPFLRIRGAKIALDNGKKEGVNLGRYILNQGFSEAHLIAHSAGAGLIQAALETIKALRPDIVVHLTFLDPFVGTFYTERFNYGKGADWTDSYFSQDYETSGGAFLFTESALEHGYNVNITWLDTKRRKIEVVSSTASGDVSQTCYEIHSSHRWPCEFYLNTIPPSSMFGSEGFGFPLSKEGGNWDFATNNYKVGKNSLKVLGSGELSCVPNPSPNSLHIELPQDFSKLPNASVIINSPGNVIIHGIDFELRTASPAWLAAVIPITNRVNFVSLEAKFTSASGAEGLLTVYGETNVLGSVDERVTSGGVHQYTFPFPETATNGTRTMGFRLDAFTTIQSSVTITNVALGFAGVREPFSLSFVGSDANRLPILQLNGPSGYNYSVESSMNLIDWKTVMILVNTNGTVRFIDSNTNNATAKFYRAVAP